MTDETLTLVGAALLTAADAAAARTAVGATATGSSLLTAGTAAAARGALAAGALGDTLFTAATEAAARLTLDVYQRGIYAAGGLVSAPKLWIGSATTNASGLWSADVSAAGFSSITAVAAICERNNAAAIEACQPMVTSKTNTTINGNATRGVGLIGIGDTTRFAPSG